MNSSANGRLRSRRDRDLLVELLLERPMVAETGQPVAQGVEPRPVVGLAEPVALLVEPLRPGEQAT